MVGLGHADDVQGRMLGAELETDDKRTARLLDFQEKPCNSLDAV